MLQFQKAQQLVRVTGLCVHCGTELGTGARGDFCCGGCEQVYRILHDLHLEHYYDLRANAPPVCPAPAAIDSHDFAFCDDAKFIAQASPDGRTMRFFLSGLNCTACLWLLEKLPDFCNAASSTRVNMSTSTIEVVRKPNASFAAIAETLNKFGYQPRPLRESDTVRELQKKESQQDLVRIGVAAFSAGNIMILAVSLYGGATGELGERFKWLSLFLSTPCLTFAAWPFYRNAWTSLKTRSFNIDLPIVAALVSGIIMSLWGLASGGPQYFDSLTTLVLLLLASRFVMRSMQSRLLTATHLEDDFLIMTARRFLASGAVEEVSSLTLKENDEIELSSQTCAASVPADGEIVSGRGFVDTAILTGESTPIQVGAGDQVFAGQRILTGTLRVRVLKPTVKSRVAEILRETELAAQNKSRFVHLSDRVAKWFVLVVFSLAIATVVYFTRSHHTADLAEGVARALALVIVTCPCVFGMAIPLSMAYAMRASARRGMIIKTPDAIEKLWRTKTIYFDKTGTLTEGALTLIDLPALSEIDRAVICALEKDQPHPVAKVLTRELAKILNTAINNRLSKTASQELVSQVSIQNVHLLESGGICGEFMGSPVAIRPVNPVNLVSPLQKFAPENKPENKPETTSDIAPDLHSHFGYFKNQTMLAEFKLGDRLRTEASTVVRELKKQNYQVRMISGDRAKIADVVANKIGLFENEWYAEVTPEEKSRLIRQTSDSRNGVMMIGDGANDAAALAAADVGVAMNGSMELSLRAADVYLARADLSLVPQLLEITHATRRAIQRNLGFSLAFNLLSGSLAIAGYMTPLWAAVLMPMSSLTVLVSANVTGSALLRSVRK